MSVYVDCMRAPYGRMLMCHMVADTPAELYAMADRIGVPRKWVQAPGTVREHFDISLRKRALALGLGAQVVTRRWMGERLARLRAASEMGHASRP